LMRCLSRIRKGIESIKPSLISFPLNLSNSNPQRNWKWFALQLLLFSTIHSRIRKGIESRGSLTRLAITVSLESAKELKEKYKELRGAPLYHPSNPQRNWKYRHTVILPSTWHSLSNPQRNWKPEEFTRRLEFIRAARIRKGIESEKQYH